MNKHIFSLTMLVAATFAGHTAHATLGSDDFQGAALGTLDNQNTGTGWTNPWVTVPANSTVAEVVDLTTLALPPLTYTFPGQGTGGSGAFVVSNRAVRITGNGNSILTRTVGPVAPDTVYVGLLLRIDSAPTFPDNAFFSFWLDNTKSETRTSNPSFGFKANGGNGSTVNDIFARLALDNEAFVPSSDLSGRIGESFFLVARLNKSISGASNPYTSITLWFNPGTTDETNAAFPEVQSVTGSALTSFSEVGLRTANLPAGFVITVGPVSSGPTFASVFPTPGGPLAVTLESFDGVETSNGVDLTWVTSAEIDNAGFNIYRETITGFGSTGLVKLTSSLIPAEGSETSGATYSFTDSTPVAVGEERRYFLEDVEFGGATKVHGPVIFGGLPQNNSVNDWIILH